MRIVHRAATVGAQTLVVAGISLLLSFALATVADGISRAVIGQPIDIVRDVGGLVLAVSIATCLPWAFLNRQNIVINFIDVGVSRATAKALSIFAALITLVVITVLAWQFFLHARNLSRAGDITAMMGWSKAPFWYIVDVIFWFAVAAQAVVVIDEIVSTQPGPLAVGKSPASEDGDN